MDITVKNLLQLDIMQGASIIAGASWLDNQVKGITIIEAPDILNWLKGGEVLLTSLYTFRDKDLTEAVKQMKEKNISALFVKEGRVPMDDIARVAAAGEKYGMPIILLTWEHAFIHIMYYAVSLLLENNTAKLESLKNIRNRFAQMVVEEQGLDAMLEEIDRITGYPALFYDHFFNIAKRPSGNRVVWRTELAGRKRH